MWIWILKTFRVSYNFSHWSWVKTNTKTSLDFKELCSFLVGMKILINFNSKWSNKQAEKKKKTNRPGLLLSLTQRRLDLSNPRINLYRAPSDQTAKPNPQRARVGECRHARFLGASWNPLQFCRWRAPPAKRLTCWSLRGRLDFFFCSEVFFN